MAILHKFFMTSLPTILMILMREVWGSGQTVAGIQFGDNKAQRHLTGDNGIGSITVPVSPPVLCTYTLHSLQVAKQMTFCTWLYPQWSRWGVSVGCTRDEL